MIAREGSQRALTKCALFFVGMMILTSWLSRMQHRHSSELLQPSSFASRRQGRVPESKECDDNLAEAGAISYSRFFGRFAWDYRAYTSLRLRGTSARAITQALSESQPRMVADWAHLAR